jgi:hypothetical protein
MGSVVLAIDHSLCNTGFVVCAEGKYSAGLFQRKQDKQSKHAVWAQILDMGQTLLTLYKPATVILESPNVARSEGAAASKFSVYALAGIFANADCAVHYVTARKVKEAAGLIHTASKTDMVQAMYARFAQDITWFYHHGKICTAKNEHIADALGALEAYKRMTSTK